MALVDWLRILLLSLFWGSSFFHIEIALRDAGPFTIVLVRLALAAVALILYCLATGTRVPELRPMIGAFLFMGVTATALPFSLITLGQTRITSGLTATFIASTPLLTVLVAHLWGRAEPATPAKLAGVVTGLAGVGVLMGPDVLAGLSGSAAGQLAMIGAALSYSVASVFGRRFRDLPAPVTAAGMLTAASLVMAPVAFGFETPLQPLPGPAASASIGALALLSTALAYILYFRILASAGSTNAMLVTLVQPPLAILLGVLFLDETLALNQTAGLVLIVAGLLLVDGRIVKMATGRA